MFDLDEKCLTLSFHKEQWLVNLFKHNSQISNGLLGRLYCNGTATSSLLITSVTHTNNHTHLSTVLAEEQSTKSVWF